MYINGGAPEQNTTICDMWQGNMRTWLNWSNTNKALIQRFLSLIPQEHGDLYSLTLIGNPNGTFQECFKYFYKEYGIKDESEIEDSCDGIKKPRNPAEIFEVLRKRFDDGITFATFSDNAITPTDAPNMLINAIMKTGTFQSQYEALHYLPKSEHTLANAFKWRGKKTQIKNKFAKLSGNIGCEHQYGMSGVQLQ